MQPVYSLRVDTKDHSFLTNGFVSHNTEARLSRIATEMLRDIDANTVDFEPNYDESRRQPSVLPSRFPNLLVNGSTGIAVGMATNMPPHHLGETIDAVVAMIDNPDIDVEGLMKHIKGPDFPTGAYIVGRSGIRDAYRTGRGRVVMRARAHIEELRGGKSAIVISELPYGVKKGGDTGVIRKIADLVQEKVLTEISDLADHSDRTGMRIQVELKRDAMPQVALNKLFKHTPLQSTFGYNAVALVDGVPKTLSLLELVTPLPRLPARGRHPPLEGRAAEGGGARARPRGLPQGARQHRRDRRAHPRRRRHRRRAHAADGAVRRSPRSRRRRSSTSGSRASPALARQGDRGGVQGPARAHRRAARRSSATRREIDGADPRGAARDQADLRQATTTAAPRSSHAEEELELEDLIAEEDMVIAITQSGYIKRLPVTAYREQKRGGIGVMGMELKDEDYIEHLFVASTHDYILFFTNVGKVYRLKVHELPLGSRQSKGRAIVNLLPFRQDETVRAVVQTRDFEEAKYLVFGTKNGVVKKTELKAYNTPLKADGIIAIKMREGDELVGVRHSSGDDDILMVSKLGQAIRFNETGRAGDGPRRLRRAGHGLRGDDEVISINIAQDDADLLVVTENGYGKRTRVADYPRQGPRRHGREDDPAHRGEGHARRRARRPRRLPGDAHLDRRHRDPDAGRGGQAARPRRRRA